MKRILLILVGGFGVTSALAAKQEVTAPRPQVFQKVIDCRQIADNAKRLACYDDQVAQLDSAETSKAIMVVDQAEVRKARKGLFGLNLSDFDLFKGRGEREEEEFSQIETTIKQAFQNNGKWVIILEDGARWTQTDGRSLRTPKPGQPIKIRKAAMGGFFGNVNGQVAIRMMRLN